MTSTSSMKKFHSIVVMPILMGLGHLAPAIGTIHVATGSYQFPWYLLGMIAAMATLVDSLDKYKDTLRRIRPHKWIWRLWMYSLCAIIFICTACIGLPTAMQIYRFLFLGLGWGTPCIPLFSQSAGVQLHKPKTVLREAKSLVVAICMGYITADTCSFYYCHVMGETYNASSLRTQNLYLTILYQFFRETTCDIRDIKEDTRDGMRTLPVRLGKERTLLLLAGFGVFLDILITRGIIIADWGSQVNLEQIVQSVSRIGVTMGVYAKILQYPKGSSLAWGIMSLFGLTPVLWAQSTLREGTM